MNDEIQNDNLPTPEQPVQEAVEGAAHEAVKEAQQGSGLGLWELLRGGAQAEGGAQADDAPECGVLTRSRPSVWDLKPR